MIYIAVQLIQIFSAGGQTDGRTEVVQEVLGDLKQNIFLFCLRGRGLQIYLGGLGVMWLQSGHQVFTKWSTSGLLEVSRWWVSSAFVKYVVQ